MKVRFLGTGGGRYVTGEQKRKTAGIVVETEETRLVIDPGPGALVYAHEELENPLETHGTIISHAHTDHSNDAGAIVEMITEAGDMPGAVFGSESVLEGYGTVEKCLSDYHQDLCRTVETLEDGFETEFRDLEIRAQEMFHSDPKTAGFLIESDEKSVGFWTDSEYSEELVEFYSGADILVVYCSRPRNSGTPSHTSLDEVPEILEHLDVNTVIVTHFGYKFLESDLEEQQEWLSGEVDAKVIFAEDSMEFPGNRSLGDF